MQRNQHHFPTTSQGGRCTSSNTFFSKLSYHFSPLMNLNHSATLHRISHKSHISKKRNARPVFPIFVSYWKPPFKNISECISTCQRNHGTLHLACLTLRGSSSATGKVPKTQSTDVNTSSTSCV